MKGATKKRRLARARRPKGRRHVLANLILREAVKRSEFLVMGGNRLGKTAFLGRITVSMNDTTAAFPPLEPHSTDALVLFKFDKLGLERVKEGKE